MKVTAVQDLKAAHPLVLLLAIAKLPASTYHAHCTRRRHPAPDRHADLDAAILTAVATTKGRYGHRRMRTWLQREGHSVSKKTVHHRMQHLGVLATPRRARRPAPRPGTEGIRPNLLNRQFTTTAPNETWVTDMTEFRVNGDRLYCSPVMDLFDRQIIGYATGRSASARLAVEALRMASQTLTPGATPLIHTDQGVPYRHREWDRLLTELGATGSMSRQGTPLDNAVIESFFARLKEELCPETFASLAELEAGLHEHLHWYNQERITGRPGGLSPVAVRAAYVAQYASPPSGSFDV